MWLDSTAFPVKWCVWWRDAPGGLFVRFFAATVIGLAAVRALQGAWVYHPLSRRGGVTG